jgi:hypothetical protein
MKVVYFLVLACFFVSLVSAGAASYWLTADNYADASCTDLRGSVIKQSAVNIIATYPSFELRRASNMIEIFIYFLYFCRFAKEAALALKTLMVFMSKLVVSISRLVLIPQK